MTNLHERSLFFSNTFVAIGNTMTLGNLRLPLSELFVLSKMV